ncbi:MAG: hypothetical protein M3R17_20095 [Bacteroidota bacterium]|nr:hypothetical protein [Bacteroidota bacterium]
MKTIYVLLILSSTFGAVSCKKDEPVSPTPQQTQQQQIPNGSFENWSNQLPGNWTTNSFPAACVTPYETYIVRQDTFAHDGQFAAKFIYNNTYAAWAHNGFSITSHSAQLSAYVRCMLVPTDSVLIRVKLFNNNTEVDNGEWYGTSSIANYTQIIIPVSQNATMVDSASIYIEGGHRTNLTGNNTEFWVDDIELQ